MLGIKNLFDKSSSHEKAKLGYYKGYKFWNNLRKTTNKSDISLVEKEYSGLFMSKIILKNNLK